MNQPTSSSRLKYSKRLTAAGAASAAILMTAGSASAAITVVDVNALLPYGSGFVSFNAPGSNFTNGYDTSYTAAVRNCGVNLLSFNTSNFEWTPTLLAYGSVVGSSQSFSSASSVFIFQYPAEGEMIFAGYRLKNQGPGNDETHYGYVQITGNANMSFTLDTYTYESTPNTSITVVPEASSFLLGTAGVAALALRRRRIQRTQDA